MSEYVEPGLCGYLAENKFFVLLSFLAVLVPFFVTIHNSYTNWKKSEEQEYKNNQNIEIASSERLKLLSKNEELNHEVKEAQRQTISKSNKIIEFTRKSTLINIENQQKALERVTAPYIQIDKIHIVDGILSLDIKNIGPNPINLIAIGAYATSSIVKDDEIFSFHNNTALPTTESIDEFFVKNEESPQFEKRLTRAITHGETRDFQMQLFQSGHVDVMKKSHGYDLLMNFEIKFDLAIDGHELDVEKRNGHGGYVIVAFELNLNNLNVSSEDISINNRWPKFIFNSGRFLRSNGDGTATLIPPKLKHDE